MSSSESDSLLPSSAEPAPPAPYYADGGRTVLHCGDARDLLQTPCTEPVAVVLTDPPYAAWRYLRELREHKRLSLQDDLEWQANIFSWVTEWYWQMQRHLAAGAASWVFCNVNYLGFYLRWARMVGWENSRLYALAEDEFLIYSGPPLAPLLGERVGQALARWNQYGHGKDVVMLRTILKASPPGHVLDPFAGTGSTLLAARAEGRTSCGIEIVEESCRLLADRLRLQ